LLLYSAQISVALLVVFFVIPQKGSGLGRGSSAPNLANWSAFSLPSTPLCRGTQTNLTLFHSASSGSTIPNQFRFDEE
jgi:hypothetical protein